MDRPFGNAALLHPGDNVVTACRALAAGETVAFSGRSLVAADAIETGHKIACAPIAQGEAVIKCGVPIGSATRGIAVGEHVHLHNLKSDYIATFTRTTGSGA